MRMKINKLKVWKILSKDISEDLTVFILQVVPTSRSSRSLVLCGKSFLRQALVHYKYIGHGIIDKIRTQQRVKFFLSFSATT